MKSLTDWSSQVYTCGSHPRYGGGAEPNEVPPERVPVVIGTIYSHVGVGSAHAQLTRSGRVGNTSGELTSRGSTTCSRGEDVVTFGLLRVS